eukprot:GFKZ01013317.1.p1 GENE.GFKZ01013317.1~~GFKZ01013317.1.p1  ORF type:complete len:735 (+),score=88.97 GFKZ01013317.1:41-2206(+)
MRLATLATCSLNQWALDIAGNLERTRRSISLAREQGARYRVGPELETTGYGCEDHFHEPDTVLHSWEAIARLIAEGYTDDMLVDVGAPVLHRGVMYNARVLMVDRRVVLIRPKVDLADHGNYREARWFRAWDRGRGVESFVLPRVVREVVREVECYIGYAVLQLGDGVTVGCETCEELWTADAPHIAMGMEGVEIVGNGSASHHVLRKLKERVALLESATRKGGGVYLYANQMGCDGGRLYYDGSPLVALNGTILKQGAQFGVGRDVQVVVATVDLDEVVAFRMGMTSRGVQAARKGSGMQRVQIDGQFTVCLREGEEREVTAGKEVVYCSVEQEIGYGPACWLWDYLRRSGMNGFFLALSGGADSSATAAIVGSMCQMLVEAVRREAGDGDLLREIRRVTGSEAEYAPTDARELAGRILHTMYMGNGKMSSVETQRRAQKVSGEIGAWHADVNIDGIVEALLKVFEVVFGRKSRPKFAAFGGCKRENLALQCVQARVRMVLGYMFAQLILWASGRQGGLLVLGSGNVDEGLRGYLTKYDCSSADLNPIGGISKVDLKVFLRWAAEKDGLGYEALREVVEATPTAELEPIVGGKVQTDEEDMGMTYVELGWFGRLRKLGRCGPWSMYQRLKSVVWRGSMEARTVADKVKHFYRMYSINRHKMTVLTPSYHAEDYSPDDNRFDLRQFLYNVTWKWQFAKIDADVESGYRGIGGDLLNGSVTK